MRVCLEMLTDEKLAAGLSVDDARRAARLEFGGLDQVKEQVLEIRAGAWLESIGTDIRHGLRSLAGTPTVTLAALLSLALGIGLNTAVFSVIHAVVLNQVPYREPDRLVNVSATFPGRSGGVGLPPADYLDLERDNAVFENMSVFDQRTESAAVGRPATLVPSLRVSADFFDVLGVAAARGRTFLPEEDRPDADAVVVSDEFWRTHLGANPSAVGRPLTVDGTSRTLIGVMPSGFRFYHPSTPSLRVGLWQPYAFARNPATNRMFYTTAAIARLRPGVTVGQAREATDAAIGQLNRQYPRAPSFSSAAAWVAPLREDLARPARQTLAVAWGLVAIVLLVACANVASLLLARTEARARELAVRASLGAGRLRLVRQMLVESLLLSAAGGLAGLALAYCAPAVLGRLIPDVETMSRVDEAHVNVTVLGFAVLTSVVAGLAFGIAPAWRGSAVNIRGALAASARRATEHRGAVRARHALLVGQIALSMALLVGSALLLNSIWRLHRAPLGFEPARVLALHAPLPSAPPFARDLGIVDYYGGAVKLHEWTLTDRAVRFPQSVVTRVGHLPGVEHAAVAVGLPMLFTLTAPFTIEGQPQQTEPQPVRGWRWLITPGYFDTMGIPLIQGRRFADSDVQGHAPVAIINRAMAHAYWPGRTSVVGEHIRVGDPAQVREIVGVVGDVRALPTQETSNQIYVPLAQDNDPAYIETAVNRLDFHVLVRSRSDPGALARDVEAAIAGIEPSAPLQEVQPLSRTVARAFAPWRSTTWLFGLSAGLAVLLAMIGLYGVMAYTVKQRTHEIGVRMALGADPRRVRVMVLRRAAWVIVAGIGVGLAGARAATTLLEHRLYGVSATDVWTLTSVAGLLAAIAIVASYVPARRAAAIDPIQALRCE
jgi:predicted permease